MTNKLNLLFLSNLTLGAPTNVIRVRPIADGLRKKGHNIVLAANDSAHFAAYGAPAYLMARALDIITTAVKTNEDYDVIYGSKPSAALEGLLIARRLGAPSIFDQDDLEGIFPSRLFWQTSLTVARHVDKVVVSSSSLYELYKTIRNDVVYLPSSVDVDGFKPVKKKVHVGEPLVLWVSSGTPEPLEARLVMESMMHLEGCKFLVIGRGGSYVSQYIEGSALAKRVRIMGWVPKQEILNAYATCDIALLPLPDTLWHRCKCPGRLWETVAMELPFVATVGEPAFVARKFGCGLVAKPEPRDIARTVMLALSRLDDLTENAKRARIYLETHQTAKHHVDVIEKILYEVARNKAR